METQVHQHSCNSVCFNKLVLVLNHLSCLPDFSCNDLSVRVNAYHGQAWLVRFPNHETDLVGAVVSPSLLRPSSSLLLPLSPDRVDIIQCRKEECVKYVSGAPLLLPECHFMVTIYNVACKHTPSLYTHIFSFYSLQFVNFYQWLCPVFKM